MLNGRNTLLEFSFAAAIKPPRGSLKEELRRQIAFEFQKRWIHDNTLEEEILSMYLGEIKKDRRSYMTACISLISGKLS